ncbi:hypothetical protein Tco_0692633 [Tanacetum coccineum]
MTTLEEHIIVVAAENRSLMLEKSMYDSWASRIRLFIKGKKHGRMMLDLIDNGPLVYPTVEENGQTRPKKYSELTEAQQLQDDCDVQAMNIILHGLPPDVYALVNQEAQYAVFKIWNQYNILEDIKHDPYSKKSLIRHMAPLPPREQRHPFLRVQVVDFQWMPELMRDGLFARMAMEHRDDVGVVVFTSLAWGRLFVSVRRSLETIEMEAVYLGLGITYRGGDGVPRRFLRTSPSYTLIRDPVLRLCHRMMAHSIAGRSQAPEKVTVTDLFYLRGLDVGSVNILHIVGQISREGLPPKRQERGYNISSGQFVARLAEHFGLLTAEILGGLMVIAPELLIIDIAELVRLQICAQFDDTWAWVAMGPKRQPDAVVGAHAVAKDAPVADEGDQAVPAPVQAPQQLPPPPPSIAKTMPQRMARLEEDMHKIFRALTEQREVIDAMARDFLRFNTWAVTGLALMMDRAGVAYVPYSETHVPYQRHRVRQRTGEASTSAAQQDLQQPDP